MLAYSEDKAQVDVKFKSKPIKLCHTKIEDIFFILLKRTIRLVYRFQSFRIVSKMGNKKNNVRKQDGLPIT